MNGIEHIFACYCFCNLLLNIFNLSNFYFKISANICVATMQIQSSFICQTHWKTKE